jgi:hypothetical protein
MRLMRRRLLVCATAIVACGPRAPEDWMFDTFSEFGDGDGQEFPYSGLGKLAFDPDGTGTHTSLGACGRDVTETPFSWEPRGPDALAIIPEPGEPFVFHTEDHEWRIALTGECTFAGVEKVALQQVRDGMIQTERTMYRGDLCLERFECSDGTGDIECTDCRTVWCDEPPASCAAD